MSGYWPNPPVTRWPLPLPPHDGVQAVPNQRIRTPETPWTDANVTRGMRTRARLVGARVEPSKRKGAKLDVFDLRTGDKLGSIGELGYGDYDYWQALERAGDVPLGFADVKRELFRKRHYANALAGSVDRTPGYLAYMILW